LSSPDLSDDVALLQAIGRGDSAAVARLYERHGPKMIAFARRYVDAGIAEDVVAGLVQRWLERPPVVRDSERLAAFLATSVYHAAIDWIRRDRAEQGRPPRSDVEYGPRDQRPTPPISEARDERTSSLREQLQVVLDRMSHADRLLLEVHYGQALTPDECMSLLQISRSAFHQRLHRARVRLARLLAAPATSVNAEELG
jgi:RNA polymerase sigma-70 factor, ECF subfamily